MLAAHRSMKPQNGAHLNDIHPLVAQLAHDAGQRLHRKACRQAPAHNWTRIGNRHLHSVFVCSGEDSSACPTPERRGYRAQHALIGPAAQQHGEQTQEAAYASTAAQAACLKHSGLFVNRSPMAHSNCSRYGAKQPLLCNDAVQGIALSSTSTHGSVIKQDPELARHPQSELPLNDVQLPLTWPSLMPRP